MKKMIFSLWLAGGLLVPRAGTRAQNTGIGTSTPKAFFNVAENKTVLFGGDTTSIGSKFIWYGSKSALRFGQIDPLFDNTAWDNANVGVNSLAFGASSRASGAQSIASGVSSTASGGYAWAHGFAAQALGNYALAFGQDAGALADESFAFGSSTRALGYGSWAIGGTNAATGTYSLALGIGNVARCYGCVVLGRNADSVNGSSQTSWSPDDPLLIAGNGAGYSTRSNALTLLKGGVLGINVVPTWNNYFEGVLAVKGTNAKVQFSLESQTNTNRWSWYVSSAGQLQAYYNSVLKGTYDITTGAYSSVSDARLKKNIEILEPVLERVMALRPCRYEFKVSDRPHSQSLGFVAQEVRSLFPEAVSVMGNEKKDPTLGLNYANFGVIAIKAIQEQQLMIRQQQERIESLEKRLGRLEAHLQ